MNENTKLKQNEGSNKKDDKRETKHIFGIWYLMYPLRWLLTPFWAVTSRYDGQVPVCASNLPYPSSASTKPHGTVPQTVTPKDKQSRIANTLVDLLTVNSSLAPLSSPGHNKWYSHSVARPAAQCKNPNGRRQITSPWFRDTFSLSRHENHVSYTFMDSKFWLHIFLYSNSVNLTNRIWFTSQGTPTYSVFSSDESQFKL
jgi:hypothetical protein